jgi:hypothetical protein
LLNYALSYTKLLISQLANYYDGADIANDVSRNLMITLRSIEESTAGSSSPMQIQHCVICLCNSLIKNTFKDYWKEIFRWGVGETP